MRFVKARSTSFVYSWTASTTRSTSNAASWRGGRQPTASIIDSQRRIQHVETVKGLDRKTLHVTPRHCGKFPIVLAMNNIRRADGHTHSLLTQFSRVWID